MRGVVRCAESVQPQARTRKWLNRAGLPSQIASVVLCFAKRQRTSTHQDQWKRQGGGPEQRTGKIKFNGAVATAGLGSKTAGTGPFVLSRSNFVSRRQLGSLQPRPTQKRVTTDEVRFLGQMAKHRAPASVLCGGALGQCGAVRLEFSRCGARGGFWSLCGYYAPVLTPNWRSQSPRCFT